MSNHALLLTKFNKDIFKRNVFTDIELVVDGHEYKAHRFVLSCFSPYLNKKLLNENEKEARNKVIVPKIGTQEFETLLNYMYSGNLVLTIDNFFEVYKAASVLEMQEVIRECLKLLESKEDIKKYYYSLIAAKKLNNRKSYIKTLKLLAHRFEEAVMAPEFLRIDVNCAIDLLRMQAIGARSEVIVFLAALNWLNYDHLQRQIYAIQIMECVRFCSMSMEEIVACFNPPILPQILEVPGIRAHLFEATSFITAKYLGEDHLFKQYSCRKRELTFKNLPMKLWNEKKSPATPVLEASSQTIEFNASPKYTNKRNATTNRYGEAIESKISFESFETTQSIEDNYFSRFKERYKKDAADLNFDRTNKDSRKTSSFCKPELYRHGRPVQASMIKDKPRRIDWDPKVKRRSPISPISKSSISLDKQLKSEAFLSKANITQGFKKGKTKYDSADSLQPPTRAKSLDAKLKDIEIMKTQSAEKRRDSEMEKAQYDSADSLRPPTRAKSLDTKLKDLEIIKTQSAEKRRDSEREKAKYDSTGNLRPPEKARPLDAKLKNESLRQAEKARPLDAKLKKESFRQAEKARPLDAKLKDIEIMKTQSAEKPRDAKKEKAKYDSTGNLKPPERAKPLDAKLKDLEKPKPEKKLKKLKSKFKFLLAKK